jgi:CRISPR-associated protein Cmr3
MIPLLIEPEEPLVFPRPPSDAPPEMAASGHWPAPSVVSDAIHAALHRTFPQVQLWEQNHATRRHGHYANRSSKGQRFGSLVTAGPFPCRHFPDRAEWFFPGPSHAVIDAAKSISSLLPAPSPNDAGRPPKSWLHPLKTGWAFGSPTEPLTRLWWSKDSLERFLSGGVVNPDDLYPDEAFYRLDEGNPALRLNPGIGLGALATLPLRKGSVVEGLQTWFDSDAATLLMGRQHRVCRARRLDRDLYLDQLLPLSAPITSQRVAWLLLSPAVFPVIEANPTQAVPAHPGGWLPTWISPETGQVQLKKNRPPRSGLHRDSWRQQIAALPALDCRLVAACVPAPILISGWSERKHLAADHPSLAMPGPKSVHRAVPAGAVYFFEGPDAAELADQLAWHGSERQNVRTLHHRRSTLFGEKGFGLGVCGPWDYSPCA